MQYPDCGGMNQRYDHKNPGFTESIHVFCRYFTRPWVSPCGTALRITSCNSAFWPTFGRSNLLLADLVSCSNLIRLNLVTVFHPGFKLHADIIIHYPMFSFHIAYGRSILSINSRGLKALAFSATSMPSMYTFTAGKLNTLC